jgi:hypothetical protein
MDTYSSLGDKTILQSSHDKENLRHSIVSRNSKNARNSIASCIFKTSKTGDTNQDPVSILNEKCDEQFPVSSYLQNKVQTMSTLEDQTKREVYPAKEQSIYQTIGTRSSFRTVSRPSVDSISRVASNIPQRKHKVISRERVGNSIDIFEGNKNIFESESYIIGRRTNSNRLTKCRLSKSKEEIIKSSIDFKKTARRSSMLSYSKNA